jgi:hypothetical protein
MKIIKIISDDKVREFNTEAPKHEVVVAGFFMVGCPACSQFKPEWEEFIRRSAKNKKKGGPSVLIAEIDSNQASKVDFDTSTLEGFPSVFINKKGEKGLRDFERPRKAAFLEKFLDDATKQAGGRKSKGRRRKKAKKRIRKRTRRKNRKSRSKTRKRRKSHKRN